MLGVGEELDGQFREPARLVQPPDVTVAACSSISPCPMLA